MFYIKGSIKDDKQENYTRKDGTAGQKRILFIEPEGSIYPVKVDVPLDKKYGKVGDKVEIKVNVAAFHFVDKQRRRAFLSVYVPKDEVSNK
jgi:hypothetical protein